MSATRKFRLNEDDSKILWEELSSLFPEEPDLVMVEELARELAKTVARPREISTKILDLKNKVVRYSFDIIKENLPGHIKEITVRSPSKNFSILIMADNIVKINRSYEELAALSPSSETISAYKEVESGLYVLHIKDIYWTTNILATIYVAQPITFNNIWAVFDVQL